LPQFFVVTRNNVVESDRELIGMLCDGNGMLHNFARFSGELGCYGGSLSDLVERRTTFIVKVTANIVNGIGGTFYARCRLRQIVDHCFQGRSSGRRGHVIQ
jgi:hypothetical protein